LTRSDTFAPQKDPDQNRDAEELISSKGYPVEAHFVTTPDDFVLQVFRIPRPGSPVVFLQHGVLDSADTWILNYANNSLAFMMFDAGFDVWLGNSRGNKYSTNNTRLPSCCWPFNGAFWDWDWDAMAQYDVPSQVNYVLESSGQEKLIFVGHSQGTTQAFANFATPSWTIADKISLFVGLAPVAHVYNTMSPLLRAVADIDIDKLIQFFHINEFLPTNAILQWLLPETCKVTPALCEFAIYAIAGLDAGDLDQSRLPVYVSHFPSGTSVRDMAHWAQSIRANKFQRYDYGLIGNLEHYKQTTPPQYSFSGVALPPMAIFYGGKDDLADPTDVETLLSMIPSSALVHVQKNDAYAHLDFVWGSSITPLYDEVIALSHQFSGTEALSSNF
jgi:pimeloyl-ACP methyl ester carboxylesterase